MIDQDAPKSVWILGLFVTLGSLLLLSLGKPYHMDDHGFLAATGQILDDFPHLYQGTRGFLGKMSDWSAFPHPPLIPLYLAGWIALIGNPGPIVLHATYFPFVILAAVSFHASAKACKVEPRWATLFFLASPCFFVSAQSLMSDVPMMAFFLSAIALYLVGCSRRNNALLLLAGLACTLAWLSRYFGALALVVMAFHAFRARQWKPLVVVSIVPVLAFLFWSYGTAQIWGQSHIAIILKESIVPGLSSEPLIKLGAFVSFLGGGIGFPPLLLITFFWKKRSWVIFLGAIALTILAVAYLGSDFAWERMVLLGLCILSGITLLIATITHPSLARPWLLGLFAILAWSTPFASVRYLLPLAPAACLLLVSITPKSLRPIMFVATLALSLTLSVSDMQWSRGYHNIAQEIAAHPQKSQELYFAGEWGWRHAMEKIDGNYLVEGTTAFEPGDLLAVPEQACPNLPSSLDWKDWKPLQTWEIHLSLPMHLLNRRANAGFYSHGWGVLPYSLSRQPADRITLYRHNK